MSVGNDVEERFGRRREETDIEVEVEENGRDIGAVEDVLQIAGGRPLSFQCFLKLAVEGRELLVHRLQFFLRRQQLFVGRLIFLVGGQGLFVDRFLLFVEVSRLWIAA